MMVDYTDTPFPGDYQPGQVEATPFLFQSQLPAHFSPATSEQSFQNAPAGQNRPATSTGVPGTPQLGTARALGPGGEMNFGQQQPMQQGGGGGGGHSHSFSTASLPSLASSSGSFSIQSHPDNQPGQVSMSAGPSPVAPAAANVFTGGGPMLFNSGAQQLQHPDGSKLQVNTNNMTPNPQPMTAPPGIGLGVSVYPPAPMSGTVPPTMFSSPVVNNPNIFPPSQPNYPFLGKMHGRDRSFSRPGPYHVSSRSGSLSIKSDADDNSIYSSASNASTWSTNTTNMIAGDMGQMTLEHRSSTPFEIPCGGHVASRGRARSFSLGKSSTNNLDFLEADLELSGSASEREGAVRADLATKAEQVRRLSPCQHGKARAFWAKRWLKLSYTPVNGFTVPRQGLYHSYTMSCKDFGLRPINSASFGKVVRSTFLGIRTRRLGVRGNSKYHYVSLRPAISTEAQRLNAYGDSSGQLHIAPPDGDFGSEDAGEQEVLTEDDSKEDDDDDDIGHLSEGSRFGGNLFGQPGQPFPLNPRSRSSSSDDSLVIRSARPAYLVSQSAPSGISGVTTGASAGAQMISPSGGHSVPPPFPVLPANSNPNAMAFWNRFVQQQDTLAQCVADQQFDQFDSNYRTFWDQTPADQLQAASQPPVSTMMADATAMSFDHCILKLVDKILQPIKPQAHASLSLLALNFSRMVTESLASLPPEVSGPLVELGNHCSQLMSRILNLYQITSAINPILSDPDHLATMISSWQQTVDSSFTIKQTALTCDCDEALVQSAILSFQSWLVNLPTCYNTYHPIEKLAEVVDSTLANIHTVTPRRAIIPKGVYLSSQVMRLLTLKSDISFGWFQLLKTWIDDYLQIACYRQEVFCPKNPPSTLSASPSHIHESPSAPKANLNPNPNPSNPNVDPNTMIAGVGAGGVGIGVGQSSSTSSHHSHSHSHSGPNLAIDTVSANYNSGNALDASAITPRPAFTQSGMATSATGPGVGGIAGPSGNTSMGGYL